MIAQGTIVGHRYRIVELIGTGGMAHVYRAVNLSTRKVVAIKVLKDEYRNDAEFLRRFEREARAVLHLSHENIVRAFDVGETDGLPYIVLEFVDGRTLKDILDENGPMPSRIAVALVVQVLDALGAAHAAGIIHRDVKPQNVIVMQSGKVKLMDFGIAREVDANTVTFAGSTVLGSVHYLSPEQAKGLPVTEGSDLYSTGIMLYEMLTGRVPFDGDTSVSIALKHISDIPVPPAELTNKVSPALNDVILRALNKDINRRYSAASEMSAHLRRALKEPTGDFARFIPSSKTQQAKKPAPKKKPHGALKIGLTVAAIVAALIGAFFILRDTYQTESDAFEVVPTIVGRSVDEAKQKTENFGFSFDIQDYENNDTVATGDVIYQTPEGGTKAKRGTVIYGIVSLGPAAPTVPNLIGLSPDEAKRELEESGLVLGNVSYRVSEVAIGYVCEQSIPAETETTNGQVIDIVISASSETTFDMPSAMDLPLNLTLDQLRLASFNNIFVRYAESDIVEDGVVYLQDPLPGTQVLPETPVTLTVCGKPVYDYESDIAFNLSVDNSGTKVLAVVQEAFNGLSYYRILYEATLEKGEMVPISFTATSDVEGTREVILFSNGTQVKQQDYTFAAKEP
ncbi:MAG: protein kinase [Clostridiales bacterium]|nr:protein kinase [Clostridiales bacterium]